MTHTRIDIDQLVRRESDRPWYANARPWGRHLFAEDVMRTAFANATQRRFPPLSAHTSRGKSQLPGRGSFILFTALISTFMLIAGCNMNSPIIEEIDSAFAVRQRNEDVVAVVRKHILPGMSNDRVFEFLRNLQDAGFSVSEYRFEGARQWPNGEVRPYADESTRRNMELRVPKGVTKLVAEHTYGRKYLMFEKTAVIVIDLDESVVQRVDARVNVSGI